MKPSLSVIVPTYKRIEQTIRTIHVLLQSEGWNTEYTAELIVSDCTPNDSLKRALIPFGTSVIYCGPNAPGISTNKNAGAAVARGSMLVFCDSDIEVEPATLRNTIAALDRHTAAAICGTVNWRGGEKDGQQDRPEPHDRCNHVGQTSYIEVIYSRYIATYARALASVDGYDETVFNMRGEGADLSMRYWRAGLPLAYDAEIQVHHRHDAPDSVGIRKHHVEWDVARDMMLLAYKYNTAGALNTNFASSVARYFKTYGDAGYMNVMNGFLMNADMMVAAKQLIDEWKHSDKPLYNFGFLDIFSDKEMFEKCIRRAPERIKKIVGISW